MYLPLTVVDLSLLCFLPLTVADHSLLCFLPLTVVDLLIEKNLNVSALDKLGNTPLHVAALSGNLNILRKLIDEGAKLDSKNMVLMFRCLLTRGQKFKVQKNGKPKPIKKILVDH